MAEFKITRFRYTWRGDWNNQTPTYYKDDVIFYQGSAWVCIRQHVPTTFTEDNEFTVPGDTFPSPAWIKMLEGKEFLGIWSPSSNYNVGSLVQSGGNVYLCIVGHQASANFNTDILKWEIFAVGSNFRNQWLPSTRYRVGDVIRYNGYTYQCVLEHTSSNAAQGVSVGNNDNVEDSTLETWSVLIENYTYVGVYQPSTVYRINDLVRYGGSILKCVEQHVSSSTLGQIDNSKFVTYLSGFNFDNEWNSSTFYAIGDVVSYGGTLHIAIKNNNNSQPGVSNNFPTGNSNWGVIAKGQNYTGQYDPQGERNYKEGDIVRRGGSLWVSLTDQTTDDSSLRPLDTSNWELVISSQNFRGSWKVDEDYNLYDVVYYRGVTYFANTPHFSSYNDFPGDNGSGFNYWSILLVGDENAVLANKGDLITYNLKRNVIADGSTSFVIGDESTIGTVNVPIGEKDQALIVHSNEGSLNYKTWGNFQRVIFVRPNGVDDDTDPDRGSNYFKPYKTLRYALEHADDGFQGTTSIKLSTGTYEEVLPLVVPVRTAIVGEELRSTTIKAAGPIPAVVSDSQYAITILTRIGSILGDIITGVTVQKTLGNLQSQDISVSSTPGLAFAAGIKWTNIIEYINFKVNSLGSMPTITGSNLEGTDPEILDAIAVLENNRTFIKAEAVAFMQALNPAHSFNIELWQAQLDKFINAIQHDLLYTGNYRSVTEARVYANSIVGSQSEDMFYVRDSSGIRNVTLRGLTGTLPALTAGQVYRIPTGGAFVSLDPGWGPDDENVWITNRSCYVQNVTTFGTGAVGQKIDGALHNGGNKSIVSNDFTQVISDGIGAWVEGDGRAELVSVFTYYAHIGMFAKDGGIIRATNGNSSYGDFGTVADGIDLLENAKFAQLNTRTEQAIVNSAFAGEVLDFILGLEFENCGQNYTTASYNIVSSGTGAVAIQEEFRDNSMFVCQTLAPGAGFNQYGNQAQSGNELTITLSTSEIVLEADILGMRIIIISGEGTGQYGYVYAYNDISKVCTVYKESNNTPGWDHILPGTPSRAILTTGTRYRIEPRPTFSDPGYTVTEHQLSTTSSWAAAVYGETNGTFSNVAGSLGTAPLAESVVRLAARFNVSKLGRTYTATLVNGGRGYAVNELVTIDGASLGGISGEHNLVIKVLSVTNNGNRSILTFEKVDNLSLAASGYFLITPSSGNIGSYSPDGQNWQNFTLPTPGNWKCLAAGNNRFVAISNAATDAAFSINGVDWTVATMPDARNWNAVIYGKPSNTTTGVFVAIADNLNAAAFSINGSTWTASTLPTAGDSTLNEWVDIAFGNNRFVAIANSGNISAVGTWTGTTITWQATLMDVIADSSAKDWVSVAYGNRRFVALSATGEIAYSFDGADWYPASMPTQDGSTLHNWKQIRYGQGVFFAVGDTGGKDVGADPTAGPSTFAATSYDGIIWTPRELASEQTWNLVAFGNPDITFGDSSVSNSKPTWITVASTNSDVVNRIYTGAKALGRVVVSGRGIGLVKIWEPGSGYVGDPTLTITDPKKTSNPTFRFRFADGVLAQPTFVSKGVSYKTSTTQVTVIGDGFADITPNGPFITLDNLERIPGPGAQFYIGNSEEFYTAVVVGINEQLLPNGLFRSTFQISPRISLIDNLENGADVLIRERYSQVRITGHDFLDIGTGNFENTNYPELYIDYEFDTQPQNEVQNLNGGRVFYTSTDQDGNFRAGKQFAVEQATGIITVSADFFDLRGLTELRLSGINVGSTAVIREFSKDPLFLQNSNNVVPTQRAIRAYLQNRLNIGGEDLLTPSFIAGTVKVGPNIIDTTAGLTINVPVIADFRGNNAGISGSILAQTFFYRSFKL